MFGRLVNDIVREEEDERRERINEIEKSQLLDVYIESKGMNMVVLGRWNGCTYDVTTVGVYAKA